MKISSIFKNTTILTDGRSWRRDPDDDMYSRDKTSKYKIKDIVDEPPEELEISDEENFKGKDRIIKIPHLNCIFLITAHWQYRQSLRHGNLDIAIEKLSNLFERNYDVISKLPYGSEFGLIDQKNYKTVFTKRRSKNGTTVYATKTLLSPEMNLRPSQYFFRESSDNSVFLKDLVKMSVGMPDADFWIRRSGQLKSLGEPSKQFDPDKIGIKVTATNIIDPNYLYYVFMNLQNQGVFAQMATGSTGLQHIKISSLAKIPFALSESLNENDDEPIRIRLRGNEDTAKRWIKSVYDQFPANPLNDRQHVMQFGDDAYVVFELTPSFNRRGAVEVKWISAHPQRKGLGSKALKTLQDLAQKNNVMLTLYPWEKGEISQHDLKRYYKKHGFRGEGGGSDYMKWDPLNEKDYDDIDDDDNRTPDIEGAKKYVQAVKRDFDQFGELPITGIMNDLEYRYNLDPSTVDQVLQPVKDDIVIYINTEFGKGEYSIYGAVRRLDKLYRSGISWHELYRMLDNHKHSIIKYMLSQIKKGATGMVMEMTIILKRMGLDWPELTAIQRSLRADKQALPESYSKEQRIEFAQKAFERGTVYGFWRLDLLDLKASEVPGAIEILNADKDRFISALLRMVKDGSFSAVKYALKNYRHHGLDWPELDVIERSVKQISESDSYDDLRKRNMDKVLKSFKLGAWNGFKNLDFFNMKAAEVPGAVEALEQFKEQFVKMLLTRMKSGDYGDIGTARNLAAQMQGVGMSWPELDIVIKSANKAFDDYDKSLGND